ncbi:GxxExxY protein [Flavobacterium sp. ACAM 123]|uniref:GxxExxY protein n=1 Tax=Flavobacterium sp. ACAM 123 TaxID=1189620 RepID=UPI001E32FE8A|nr:GxxExxY protein [Flavobacterium sp. ACAM 123]
MESVYHQCLKEELLLRKIKFISKMKVPLIYKNRELEIDFRCDLFIDNCLVVELKSMLQLNPIIEAQVQTYMKLLKAPKRNYYKFQLF